MLGFELSWWNGAMLASLGLAALAAIAVLVTTRAVIYLQDRDADANAKSFERYKIEAGERTKALEKDVVLSRVAIAEANARAAEAQLALEKFRLPRTLTHSQHDELTSKLTPFKGSKVKVWILTGSPDISSLAGNLINVFSNSGWHVARATSLSGKSFPGVLVSVRNGISADSQANTLVSYLNSINIDSTLMQPFDDDAGLEPSSNGVSSFSGDPEILVVVGSKQ